MSLVDQKSEVLNSKCTDVTDFGSEFQENLKKVIKEHLIVRGVGLAAPQIGIPQRFTVIGFTPTEEELKKNPKTPTIEQFVMVNPKITWHSKDLVGEKEGCLSIPNEFFDVPRYQKVHVEYMDENGKKQKKKARGYIARVIQHEVDHLEGLTVGRFKK